MADVKLSNIANVTGIYDSVATALDPELFIMLKNLRKSMARKLNIPGYVIFQDQSLEQMATMYPVTNEELQQIQGVGAGKAKRYGKEFLQLIKLFLLSIV